MKNRIFRALTASFFAAALLCQSLLSLPVSAEQEAMPLTEEITQTPSSATRFMGEQFFGSDKTVHTVEDDSVFLPVGHGGQSVAYSAVVTPTVYDTPNNAVRLILTNDSSAGFLHFKYTYETEQGTFTEMLRLDVQPYSARCVYPIRIEQADSLTGITLMLPSSEGTGVTLHAMEAVRIWSDPIEARGTVSSCRYREEDRTVTVKGSVYHDVMIAASKGVLGLFRLSPEQSLQDIIDDPEATPLITSALSIGFELQTSAADVAARYARYAVLICMPDGTRLPLAAPTYATTYDIASLLPSSRSDFKGVDTVLTSAAIDSNAGSAIVDVYLNCLENDRQSGYLYTVENEYFYFNRDYLAQLDATVRSLSGAACRVYLRFLVEVGDPADESAVSDGKMLPDTARYAALRVDSIEALRHLHAYTSFLCGRYDGEGQGEIAGIIVGSRVNEASVHNATGEMTLAEYIPLYGQTLNTIATAAADVAPALKIVVPVSDAWNTPIVGKQYRAGYYPAELFAESLNAYMTAHHANRFLLMVESDHNPYGLSNEYFEPINTDGEEGPIPEELIPKLTAATQDSLYISSENIELLDAFLRQHVGRNSVMSDHYFFHWTPDRHTDGNALSASYVYHYYRLFADERASAFFVSLRERELGGDLSEFSKIKYLVKYIDTSVGSMRTAFALDIFKVSSWNELIPDYDRMSTEQMVLLEGAFAERSGENVIGSYDLFDFTAANSTRGWYAGNSCRSLTVNSSEKYGKTLDAVMTADANTLAEYSDIAYRFDTPLGLEHAPYVTMSVAVDCATDADAVFEVKLVIGSEKGYMETKQVLKNGEMMTLSMNASQFAAVGKVAYIRLCAKTVMGEDEAFTVHLRDLRLDSREYDDDSLQTLIEAARESESVLWDGSAARRSDPMMLIILGGTILPATVIVAVMLGHYQKNDSDSDEEG